jgi:predicted transcriptional regulator
LQYEAVAHADNADKFAEEMLRQHHDIERLQAELASSIAQHTAEKTQLQRENAKLVRLLEEQAARPWIKTILAELQQKATTQLRKLAPPTR